MAEDQATRTTENPKSLEMKRATEKDLAQVWEIIDEDAKWLAAKGFNHWKAYYTEEMVSKMIAKKEVFLVADNGETVGTITYDTKPPKYYAAPGYGERFTNPDDPAVYVTAVAVKPDKQGKGYASQMMNFVEERVRQTNAKWLRLDCRAEVPGLVRFYEKRGFKKVNNEPIDEGDDGAYFLMEKSL